MLIRNEQKLTNTNNHNVLKRQKWICKFCFLFIYYSLFWSFVFVPNRLKSMIEIIPLLRTGCNAFAINVAIFFSLSLHLTMMSYGIIVCFFLASTLKLANPWMHFGEVWSFWFWNICHIHFCTLCKSLIWLYQCRIVNY